VGRGDQLASHVTRQRRQLWKEFTIEDPGIASLSTVDGYHDAAGEKSSTEPPEHVLIQQRLVAAVLDVDQAPHAQVQALPDDLTPREAEVLKLIAAGLSNAEIASTLVVSNATVKTHVNRIFSKTGARDRAQAVRYAYQHGIV